MSDVKDRKNMPARPFESMKKAFKSMVSDVPDWFADLPAVDIKKEPNEYLVKADLPGLQPQDITITLEDNTLILASSKEEEQAESDENFLRKERRSASFRRAFELPNDADQEGIDAAFKNGLLTLHIPRSGEHTQPARKVEIKTT